MDSIMRFYRENNGNIHRGVHYLSAQATDAYENARITVMNFINAEFSQEIIFTSGATGSINLVAFSYGEQFIVEGDEVIISAMEHHANIVPWQMMCQRKKAKLKIIPINDNGDLMIQEFEKLITPKTKIAAIIHVSNTLGTLNDVKKIISIAHRHKVHVLVDAAQSIQHMKIDVQELDCDFLVFSGHKIYGPTGIGVLYGKRSLLNEIPPYQGGGDMVDCVKFEHTTYNELPFKFEAGTSNYIDAVGMAKAIEYISDIGLNQIAEWENELLQYATEKLKAIEGLTIYGNSPKKGPIISFLLKGIHQSDTGMILDKMGIAVRTGTHCTQPLMDRYGIEGTVRVSMAFYNTREEIDYLVEGIKKVKEMFC